MRRMLRATQKRADSTGNAAGCVRIARAAANRLPGVRPSAVRAPGNRPFGLAEPLLETNDLYPLGKEQNRREGGWKANESNETKRKVADAAEHGKAAAALDMPRQLRLRRNPIHLFVNRAKTLRESRMIVLKKLPERMGVHVGEFILIGAP